ncbi:MAG TPA: hypothetical protein VM573_06500 [Actinomycetota bacterium]|nr:hypothetical protein [Actinomycetota bacterium]
METNEGRGVFASGAGALLGALGVYLLIAGFGGGVDWRTRWTFDQAGRLELEGVFIFFGLVVGVVLGAPAGAAFAVRLAGRGRALRTALLALVLAAVSVTILMRVVPTGPNDPVIAPYAVWAAVFAAGAAARAIVTRRT